MKRITVGSQTIQYNGQAIQSKLFQVGQMVEFQGRRGVVVEPNAAGHAPGHILLKDRGETFVGWANHCTHA